MDFSVKDILLLLRKRVLLITICTLSGFVFVYLISSYGIKPDYTASTKMFVSADDSNQKTANLSELDYAQKVVTTYINFLQTKAFYNKVIRLSGLDYTVSELKKMTSMSSVNNTEIFEISVTSKKAEDSYLLVKTMQELAPTMIKDIKSKAEISVVDPVELPSSPSGPNILLNTLFGGILGFILAFLASIIWEVMNMNIKNQEDLANRYQLPVLGVIPDFYGNKNTKITMEKFWHKFETKIKSTKGKYSKKNVSKEIKTVPESEVTSKKENQGEPSLIVSNKFFVAEAYNSLRTNLRFTLRNEGCKKLVVCSPMPEDGKSTTSTNLAVTIAQTNQKVLLIDCDLRKGRLHHHFGVKSSPGISDCLSKMIDYKDAIYKTSLDNLFVLPMGTLPPNPTELMFSDQMEELIYLLGKEYDYIIMDTPPINVVSDALSLVKLADGVILVVRELKTSYTNIESAISKFKFANANILGFTLNGAAVNQGKGFQSNYYFYAGHKND